MDINVLVGQTLTAIQNSSDELIFATKEGKLYWMGHHQECCEHVELEDIVGDLNDLIGSPILEADEISGDTAKDDIECTSYTWTFYKFATAKGRVTLRWLGNSNGYYSEGVDFEEQT